MTKPSSRKRTAEPASRAAKSVVARKSARDQLLQLLTARPMTTTELVVKADLSPLTACLELRALRAQGLIYSGSRGHEVIHSLAGSVPLLTRA